MTVRSCGGKRDGEAGIQLDVKRYLDAPDPHDRVIIQGEPPLDVMVQGDLAVPTWT